MTGATGGTGTARPAPPVLVYDGDCGFCTRSAALGRRVVMPAHGTVVPWQDLDLAAYGLTPQQCDQAVQFVDAGGRRYAAQDAVARLLLAGAPWWKPVAVVLLLPGVNALAGVAYRWVARNRHRLPGSSAACVLPPPST